MKIQKFVPRNRVVHHGFDVYDLEKNGSDGACVHPDEAMDLSKLERLHLIR